MESCFSTLYPLVASLLSDGATLDVNGGGYDLQIASLYDGSQIICQFDRSGMSVDKVFSRLEDLAKRYTKEGVVTDELNGAEYSVW